MFVAGFTYPLKLGVIGPFPERLTQHPTPQNRRLDSFCDQYHERGDANVRLSSDDLTIARLAIDSRLASKLPGLP